MSDTLEQIKAVVADKLGAEIGEITEDTRFKRTWKQIPLILSSSSWR